jgi:hypothetical protein
MLSVTLMLRVVAPDIQHNGTQQSSIQNNKSPVVFNVLLIVILLNVIQLTVILLSLLLNVHLPCVINNKISW